MTRAKVWEKYFTVTPAAGSRDSNSELTSILADLAQSDSQCFTKKEIMPTRKNADGGFESYLMASFTHDQRRLLEFVRDNLSVLTSENEELMFRLMRVMIKYFRQLCHGVSCDDSSSPVFSDEWNLIYEIALQMPPRYDSEVQLLHASFWNVFADWVERRDDERIARFLCNIFVMQVSAWVARDGLWWPEHLELVARMFGEITKLLPHVIGIDDVRRGIQEFLIMFLRSPKCDEKLAGSLGLSMLRIMHAAGSLDVEPDVFSKIGISVLQSLAILVPRSKELHDKLVISKVLFYPVWCIEAFADKKAEGPGGSSDATTQGFPVYEFEQGENIEITKQCSSSPNINKEDLPNEATSAMDIVQDILTSVPLWSKESIPAVILALAKCAKDMISTSVFERGVLFLGLVTSYLLIKSRERFETCKDMVSLDVLFSDALFRRDMLPMVQVARNWIFEALSWIFLWSDDLAAIIIGSLCERFSVASPAARRDILAFFYHQMHLDMHKCMRLLNAGLLVPSIFSYGTEILRGTIDESSVIIFLWFLDALTETAYIVNFLAQNTMFMQFLFHILFDLRVRHAAVKIFTKVTKTLSDNTSIHNFVMCFAAFIDHLEENAEWCELIKEVSPTVCNLLYEKKAVIRKVILDSLLVQKLVKSLNSLKREQMVVPLLQLLGNTIADCAELRVLLGKDQLDFYAHPLPLCEPLSCSVDLVDCLHFFAVEKQLTRMVEHAGADLKNADALLLAHVLTEHSPSHSVLFLLFSQAICESFNNQRLVLDSEFMPVAIEWVVSRNKGDSLPAMQQILASIFQWALTPCYFEKLLQIGNFAALSEILMPLVKTQTWEIPNYFMVFGGDGEGISLVQNPNHFDLRKISLSVPFCLDQNATDKVGYLVAVFRPNCDVPIIAIHTHRNRLALVINGSIVDGSEISVDYGAWHHLVICTSPRSPQVYMDGQLVMKGHLDGAAASIVYGYLVIARNTRCRISSLSVFSSDERSGAISPTKISSYMAKYTFFTENLAKASPYILFKLIPCDMGICRYVNVAADNSVGYGGENDVCRVWTIFRIASETDCLLRMISRVQEPEELTLVYNILTGLLSAAPLFESSLLSDNAISLVCYGLARINCYNEGHLPLLSGLFNAMSNEHNKLVFLADIFLDLATWKLKNTVIYTYLVLTYLPRLLTETLDYFGVVSSITFLHIIGNEEDPLYRSQLWSLYFNYLDQLPEISKDETRSILNFVSVNEIPVFLEFCFRLFGILNMARNCDTILRKFGDSGQVIFEQFFIQVREPSNIELSRSTMTLPIWCQLAASFLSLDTSPLMFSVIMTVSAFMKDESLTQIIQNIVALSSPEPAIFRIIACCKHACLWAAYILLRLNGREAELCVSRLLASMVAMNKNPEASIWLVRWMASKTGIDLEDVVIRVLTAVANQIESHFEVLLEALIHLSSVAIECPMKDTSCPAHEMLFNVFPALDEGSFILSQANPASEFMAIFETLLQKMRSVPDTLLALLRAPQFSCCAKLCAHLEIGSSEAADTSSERVKLVTNEICACQFLKNQYASTSVGSVSRKEQIDKDQSVKLFLQVCEKHSEELHDTFYRPFMTTETTSHFVIENNAGDVVLQNGNKNSKCLFDFDANCMIVGGWKIPWVSVRFFIPRGSSTAEFFLEDGAMIRLDFGEAFDVAQFAQFASILSKEMIQEASESMSNYEIITLCNLLAGRSYNAIDARPIFPVLREDSKSFSSDTTEHLTHNDLSRIEFVEDGLSEWIHNHLSIEIPPLTRSIKPKFESTNYYCLGIVSTDMTWMKASNKNLMFLDQKYRFIIMRIIMPRNNRATDGHPTLQTTMRSRLSTSYPAVLSSISSFGYVTQQKVIALACPASSSLLLFTVCYTTCEPLRALPFTMFPRLLISAGNYFVAVSGGNTVTAIHVLADKSTPAKSVTTRGSDIICIDACESLNMIATYDTHGTVFLYSLSQLSFIGSMRAPDQAKHLVLLDTGMILFVSQTPECHTCISLYNLDGTKTSEVTFALTFVAVRHLHVAPYVNYIAVSFLNNTLKLIDILSFTVEYEFVTKVPSQLMTYDREARLFVHSPDNRLLYGLFL